MASIIPVKNALTILMDSEILHLNERVETRRSLESACAKTNEKLRSWNVKSYTPLYTMEFTNAIIILLIYATVEQRIDVVAILWIHFRKVVGSNLGYTDVRFCTSSQVFQGNFWDSRVNRS
jgi:hypothetical protein